MPPTVHLALHFVVPICGVLLLRVKNRLRTCGVLCATIIVDFDHLLADPVYDPTRCSIGFHPLHSPFAIIVYLVCLSIPKARLVAIGLLIHMGLDWFDCFF